MRNGCWKRREQALALLASAWLVLFISFSGAHVASDEETLSSGYGSLGHRSWHRHFLQSPVPGWSPGLDTCTVCLAHGGFRALEAEAEILHPAGTWRGSPTAGPSLRLLSRSVFFPLSRAPPQI